MTEHAERPGGRRHLWPVILLLLLAAVSALLHVEKLRRGREIRKLQAHYDALVRARPIVATKARRARFYETRLYLGYPAAVSYAVADLLRRLDRVSGPLRLLDIQVDPGLHDLKFDLTVKAEASTRQAARRKFAVFFAELNDLPGIVQASFSMPEGAGAHDGSPVFVVSGQAEWP